MKQELKQTVGLARIPNSDIPRHRLFLNNDPWFFQVTVHHGARAERIRRSLKTSDLEEACRRRDLLFSPLTPQPQAAWAMPVYSDICLRVAPSPLAREGVQRALPPPPIRKCGHGEVVLSLLTFKDAHPSRMKLRQNDKVICVNDDFRRSVFGIPGQEFHVPHGLPIRGQLYTVRRAEVGEQGTQGLFLVGLQTFLKGREVGFNSTRFRKVGGLSR